MSLCRCQAKWSRRPAPSRHCTTKAILRMSPRKRTGGRIPRRVRNDWTWDCDRDPTRRMAWRMISARGVTRRRQPPHGSRDAGGDTSVPPWPRALACIALHSGLGRATQGHADWRVLAASPVAYQRCWYEDTGAEHDLCITPDALLLSTIQKSCGSASTPMVR